MVTALADVVPRILTALTSIPIPSAGEKISSVIGSGKGVGVGLGMTPVGDGVGTDGTCVAVGTGDVIAGTISVGVAVTVCLLGVDTGGMAIVGVATISGTLDAAGGVSGTSVGLTSAEVSVAWGVLVWSIRIGVAVGTGSASVVHPNSTKTAKAARVKTQRLLRLVDSK